MTLALLSDVIPGPLLIATPIPRDAVSKCIVVSVKNHATRRAVRLFFDNVHFGDYISHCSSSSNVLSGSSAINPMTHEGLSRSQSRVRVTI